MQPLIKFARSPSVAWANGSGRTTELVSWVRSRDLSGEAIPPWRLSIAELTGPAPFSALPGVRRHFLPIGGSVRLTVNGAARPVGDATVTQFTGDDEVELVELVDGPCHAVNLMVRAGSADPAGRDPGPALIAGTSDRGGGPGCWAAVSLGRADGIDRFDVIDPSRLIDILVPLPVALIGPPG